MWCGPKSCRAGKTRGGCPAGQSCVPIKEEHCFVKPCPSMGECWPPAPSPPSKCHASFSYQDDSCANITFTFNKENMPQVSYTSRGEPLNYELLSRFPPFPNVSSRPPPFSNSVENRERSGAWNIRFSSSRIQRSSWVKFSRLVGFSQALLSYPNTFSLDKKSKKYIILYNKPWLSIPFRTKAFLS